MDKQSFLDEFFRKIEFSKKLAHPPLISQYVGADKTSAFMGSFGKNFKEIKKTVYVSSDSTAHHSLKPRSRYAVTIQSNNKQTRKTNAQIQDSQRKGINNQPNKKNGLFLQVQPIPKINFLDRVFNQSRNSNNPNPTSSNPHSSNILEQLITLTKNRQQRLQILSRRNTMNQNKQSNDNRFTSEAKSSTIINESETKKNSGKVLAKSQQLQKPPTRRQAATTFKNEKPSEKTALFKKKEDLKKNYQDEQQRQRRDKLLHRKQIHLQYLKPFNPPTNVSASSYIIFEPNLIINTNQQCISPTKVSNTNRTDQIFAARRDQYISSRNNRKNNKFLHSDKIILSHNSRTPVEVASLTKIMTCILALQLCFRFQINSKSERIVIGKFQSNIGGTSAQISQGEIYTLEDLYYGLMLPSGNDASVAIACWGGRLLLKQTKSSINGEIHIHKKKECYNRFIVQMNILSKKIGLQKTNYANSHGLVNFQNKSCAYDIAILCEYAMKNQKFRKIVSTRVYETNIFCLPENKPDSVSSFNINILKPQFFSKRSSSKKLDKLLQDNDDQIAQGEARDLDSNEDDTENTKNEMDFQQKTISWQNTHKLIHSHPKQYLGIKTGITTAAGPCLASCVKSADDRIFIIVVLNCDKLMSRFKDTQNLKKWLYKKEGLVSPKKKRPKNIQAQETLNQESISPEKISPEKINFD